jgi:hypothetical protein
MACWDNLHGKYQLQVMLGSCLAKSKHARCSVVRRPAKLGAVLKVALTEVTDREQEGCQHV